MMNAAGLLPAPLAAEAQTLLEEVLLRHAGLLKLSAVDVAVRVLPWGMPETGVDGYAPSAHYVELTLSPENANFASHWRQELPATLAHELHHCRRWQTAGYGQTLLEALVSEGLAQHHERAERAGRLAMYSQIEADLTPLWQRALPLLHSPTYDHNAWFFGSEAQELPRWAGYALGFDLVQHYFAGEGGDPVCCADLPAADFRRFIPL